MAELRIDSGIERYRITAYLEEELHLQKEQEGVYCIPGCTITLETKVNSHAVLRIPRTLVTFSGEEEICRTMQYQFRLRFLSAGG